MERFYFTIGTHALKTMAQSTCDKFKSLFHEPCAIITRMELPQLSVGRFRALNSNFDQSFQGVIELIPNENETIDILNVETNMLSKDTKTIRLTSSIYIVPNLNQGLSLVQTTPFSNYLSSVVASEIFPNAPPEALKAQAVIARTFAYLGKKEFSDQPYQTCSSTACQVYLGENSITASTEGAVHETENLVLKDHHGQFAQTYYHASSGGKTERKDLSLGGSSVDYLQSQNDLTPFKNLDLTQERDVQLLIHNQFTTYCSKSPFVKDTVWTNTLDQNSLKTLLQKQNFNEPLQDISILKRGLSGRVLSLELSFKHKSTVIQGELNIRRLLGGLPSSLMIIDKTFQDGFISKLNISGRGHGHGVGLSQMGAIGRALDNQSFSKILSAYYPQTLLTQIVP